MCVIVFNFEKMMKGDLKYGLAGAAIGGILGAVGGGAAGELH